jgi:hypothetical protein
MTKFEVFDVLGTIAWTVGLLTLFAGWLFKIMSLPR